MSAQLDILSAGRIYADLILTDLNDAPAPGREVYADHMVLAPGGGAFITGAYAVALGQRVGLYGIVPAPPFETCIHEGICSAGLVDLTESAPKGSAPQLTVALTGSDDRSFITHRPGQAIPTTALPKARHLHIGEIATALENPWLISNARRAGMSISLDCGWDVEALKNPLVPELIAEIDLFLPNEEEAEQLTAHGHKLLPREALIVKRGAQGATALASGYEHKAKAQEVQVVDTTGAGDAFNAGFVSAWLQGSDIATCLKIATACGAEAVTRIGGATGLGCLDTLSKEIFTGVATKPNR